MVLLKLYRVVFQPFNTLRSKLVFLNLFCTVVLLLGGPLEEKQTHTTDMLINGVDDGADE